MDLDAGKLKIEDNCYYVLARRPFSPCAVMLHEDIIDCFNFAYGMSYGGTGEHRGHRSGGLIERTRGQIFINTFQGKMAEFAVYRFFLSKNILMNKPDTGQFGLGKWDSFDLICQGKYLSIKSTKEYGNLLLLETKDWNENGEYMVDIIKLYEMLEKNIGDYYKEGNSGAKYGRVKGVATHQEGKPPYLSKFYQTRIKYISPNGFLLPILGAFRALVEIGEDGNYRWKKDPYIIMDSVGSTLVNTTIEMSRQLGNNPSHMKLMIL